MTAPGHPSGHPILRPGSCWDRDESTPTHGQLPVYEDALATRVISLAAVRAVTVTLSAPAPIAGMAGTANMFVIRANLAPTHSVSASQRLTIDQAGP